MIARILTLALAVACSTGGVTPRVSHADPSNPAVEERR